MADKNKFTILGAGTCVQGEITAPNSIRIDGEFIGTLQSNELVAIGKQGIVKGEIKAKNVEVEGGRVEGTIESAKSVELRDGATVVGDITTKELIIQKGALFHGGSSMLDAKNKKESKSSDKVEIEELK